MQDVVIVGGGIAGATAGIYLARGGWNPLLLERSGIGGQMTQTAAIENYPGFPEVQGIDLANRLESQMEHCGVSIRYESVTEITPNGIVRTKEHEYPAKAVLLANGLRRRKLNVPGEDRLAGHGVSYCAHCDGRLYQNRTVAVVGGGNTALGEALLLSRYCSHVHLIHRRDSFSAQMSLQNRLLAQENITVHLKSNITEIFGEESVEGVRLEEGTLYVEGVFISIGYAPENHMVENLGVLDAKGYVLTDDCCATSVPWLWAAGDTRKKPLRQLITAASDGAMAAAGIMER